MEEAAKPNEPQRLARGTMAQGVGPRVRLLRNLLTVRVVRALEPFALRSGALTTMVLIAANDGCSQKDLAREMGLDKSVVVLIVDELERRGLAVRGRSTHDRRRNLLSLTPAGHELMNTMYAAASAQEEPIRQDFTEQEFALFLQFLDRAHESLLAADSSAS